MAKSVYIHIPFCENKCYYCDFNSYAVHGQPVIDYLDALEREMAYTVELYPPDKIETIFIGGGTPTVLNPEQLEVLLKMIKKYFPNLKKDNEFTVEANPGTVDIHKLKVLKDYGVNRVSMGVQAFQDELLSYIGRIHKKEDVYQSIENAMSIGLTNLSIDLMFNLPNQTMEMLKESLEKAFQLGLPHFSLYSLKVEEHTLFHTLYEKGKLPLPTEDEELRMYLYVMEEMETHGYKQYEISNFAKEGYESKHNITYWRNKEYYGLGAGAHGYIHGKRHENVRGIKEYIEEAKRNHLPRINEYQVPLKEKMEDMMFLGLRMLEGVSFKDFEKEFNRDMYDIFGKQINELARKKLIIVDKKGIRLSAQGIIYGNEVFAEFISL